MNDPFEVAKPTNYASTDSIRRDMNSDGLLPTTTIDDPFEVKTTTSISDPFETGKQSWGTTDARDAGKINVGMSAKITPGEASDRGKTRLLPALVEQGNMPGFGAMALWDKAASVLGGKDTTAAQDWYGDKFMRQASRELEQTQLKDSDFKNMEAEAAYKLPEAVGRMAAQMITMVPAGAAANSAMKAVPAVATTLSQRLGQEATKGIITGTPMAAAAASETYQRLLKNKVPEERALLGSMVSAANTYLQVMAPVSAKGSIPTRMGSAGAFNVSGELTEESLINQIVSEWPNAKIKKTDADLLVAGIMGAGMGLAFGEGKGSKAGASKVRGAPDEAAMAEAAKFVEDQAGLGKINPEAGMDFSGLKSPYYNQDGFSRGASPAQVKTANLYNEMAVKEGKDQVAGTWDLNEKIVNEKEYNKPYWPDQELQGAIKDANYIADNPDAIPDVNTKDTVNPYLTPEQLAEAQKWADQDKPAHGQMEIPPEAADIPYWADADLETAKGQANRRANAIDNLPNAAEVVPDVAGIKSPYMDRQQLIDAQNQVDKTGEPAYGQMEIPDEMGNAPYWPDKALERAKASANRAADKASQPPVAETPKPTPEENALIDSKIDELLKPAQMSEEEAMARFLKVARKKQGGHIGFDPSDNVGLGFQGTSEQIRKAASKFWQSVSPSFKAVFDSFFKLKDGTPAIWLHGTDSRGLPGGKPFTQYNVDRSDGAMIHLGQPSSSTIINDGAIKNTRTFNTNFPLESNVSRFEQQSFKDYIIQRGLGDKLTNRTTAEWKQMLDDWYKYRADNLKKAEKDIRLHLTNAITEFEPLVKKLGIKAVLDKINNHASFEELLHRASIYDAQTLLPKYTNDTAIVKFLNNLGVYGDINSNYVGILNLVKDSLKQYPVKKALANIHKAVANYTINNLNATFIPKDHHMRPTIVSVKNPLMVRDIGAWNDLRVFVEELLPKHRSNNGAYLNTWSPSEKSSSEVSPQTILGPIKGKEFTQDLVKFLEKHQSKLGESRSHFKEFYKILEKYGFDGILYENHAEAITEKQVDSMSQNFEPVFSLGVWDASKIHDLVDVPRAPKKEGGYITLPGLGKDTPNAPKTIEEAVQATKKDIGAERYIPMTMNQKALFLRNPVIKFVYDQMRTITNEADVRFNTYKTYLHDVETFLRNNRQESLKMLKVLADIQDPALKQARQSAQDTNTREAFLKEQGMPEEYIPMAIKILNVMQAVGKIDQKLALDAFGHNWHLEPMYFPREHTGPFTVTVVDSAGQVSYMRGFEHSGLAQEMATGLKNKLKDTGYVVELTRNEPNTLGDLYNMLNINAPEKTPEFLKGITDSMLKEVEVAKRKFEMERAPNNIAGYTGETVYGTNNPFSSKYDQDTKLLTLLQRRLEGSFQLENKGRLLNEVKKPLLDDPVTLMEVPNTARMVKELIARELGFDISMFQVAGRKLDKVIEEGGKVVNNLMALAKGREAWDVSYFKPNEIARFSQAYVWTMSIFKLGLSPSTLLANTSTMLTTPIDGVRTAAREGVSQAVPMAATLKLMTSHLDPEAMKFMKEAKAEGMVEARLSDPLNITNAHARGAFDRAVNYPRDLIEKSTNYSALLYYYNFYKLAYPDMNPTSREFKTKVYEAVRSWTGDYTHQAQLLAVSKTGSVGHLQSNFAKWKFNQIGRLADDVRMLGEGKVLPFATTMAMTVLMAGTVGAPIAVEYEALRRLGMKMGWWDWKPLSAFLHELKADGVMPEWAIKGPMTYYADQGAKELGLTAPDLSGNVRFSSALDINTLPVAFAGDVYKTLSGTARQVYKAANNRLGGTYPGNTVQQEKELFKGMPVVLENIYTEKMNQKYGGDSGVSQYATKDAGQYKRNEQEKNLAYLGFRSKDENDYRDKDYARGWFDRQSKADFTKYKDQIIANLDKPENIVPLAQKILELRGTEGIIEVINAAETTLKNRQTESFTRDLMTQINNPNPVAQARSLELLRKFRPAAK